MDHPGAIAALVGGLVVLAEVVKLLVARLVPNSTALSATERAYREAVGLSLRTLTEHSPKQSERLERLERNMEKVGMTLGKVLEISDRRDDDGIPLAYVPRSWAATQAQVVEALRGIAEAQRRTLELLERIERRMEG